MLDKATRLILELQNVYKMKEEVSAGGVVFSTRLANSRQTDSGHNQNDIFILVSKHSGHHGWVFPKGHVGDNIHNESAESAALREVKEETGITGKILEALSPIDYWYEFNGEKRHKIVLYFLMRYVSGNIEDHDWEMEEVEWLPLDKVEERLTYPGDKKVWREARTIMNKHIPK